MSLYYVVTGRFVGVYYMFLMTPTLLPGAVGTDMALWSNEFKLSKRQHMSIEPEPEVMQIWEAPGGLQLWRI